MNTVRAMWAELGRMGIGSKLGWIQAEKRCKVQAAKILQKRLRVKNGYWVIEQTSLNPKHLGCKSATVTFWGAEAILGVGIFA